MIYLLKKCAPIRAQLQVSIVSFAALLLQQARRAVESTAHLFRVYFRLTRN